MATTNKTQRVKWSKPPKPYKSWLEKDLHDGPLKGMVYEDKDSVVEYSIHKKYRPDFIDPDTPNILYEVKGRFRTFDEAKKCIWVQKSNPDIKIRFIIANEKVSAYPQTKMPMGKWLTKHGFEWCTAKNVPEEWRKK